MLKAKKKKVLIFGINGFVGPYLAKEFLENEYDVFGSDIHTDKISQHRITYERSNLTDSESVKKIINNIVPDIIVNLAAISSVGDSWNIPQTTILINVIGTLNILEVARKLPTSPKIMLIGSSEEYDVSDRPMDESAKLNSNNPYGISKMTQEKFAKLYRDRYGMKVYCVRAFNHTGIGQKETFVIPNWCKQAVQISLSGKPGEMRVGNLTVVRDFSNVKDIVHAYRLVIESDDCGVTYNIGSGKAFSLEELLNYIISLSMQPISIRVDPDLIRPVENPVICCDHQYITNKLGWNPKYNIFETINEMYNYYISNLKKTINN